MRSFLFVPGDSERKLSKVASSEADALVLDLEDAVSADQKSVAREMVSDFIQEQAAAKKIYVRINGPDTPYQDLDLEIMVAAKPFGLLLPKVKSLKDIEVLDQKLGDLEEEKGLAAQAIQVVMMVSETPQSVLNMAQFSVAPSRVSGYAWSGEDLAASLGSKDNRDDGGRYTEPYRLARSLTLLSSAAAGVQPIDAVFTDFRDLDGLKQESDNAARDGFSGKLAIHPDQIPIINEAFTPSDQDLERAESVIAAFNADKSVGVVGIDNKMMDLPNLIMAQNIIERAKLAGKT